MRLNKNLATLGFMLVGLLAHADRPEPGVPRVNETRFETQDYVITTHDVRDYGAEANDKVEDSSAFQKAINACNADGGGVIFVPAGTYVFRDRIIMKPGVNLRGDWQNPDIKNVPGKGTLLALRAAVPERPGVPIFLGARH